MRTTTVMTLGLALGLVAHASPAAADDHQQETVGVSVAVAVNVTKLEADLLSEELGKALSDRFDIKVVAGEAASAKLPPEGLPETCIAETECLGKTATALRVDRLLLFVAIKVGSDLQIDATLYDAKSTKSQSLPTINMTDKRSDWQAEFAKAADGLLPGAKVRKKENGTGGNGTGNGNNSNGNGIGNGMNNGSGRVDSGGPSKLPLYMVIGGGVGLVAGVGIGVWARSECGGFTCSDDDKPKGRIIAGDVIGGLGLVSLLVGGSILLFRDSDDSERVGVTTGPGDFGLAIGGSF